MKRPSVAIKLRSFEYNHLISLSNTVYERMYSNPIFLSPSPSLIVFKTAINETQAALDLRGNVHNHGTSTDMINLRVKAADLHLLLKAMAAYVENTAFLSGSNYEEMKVIIASSGFAVKRDGAPQGLLEQVRGLSRFISRSLNNNQVKIVWDHPLNVTSKNNLKSCIVYRAGTPEFADAIQIAAVSANEFIDTNNTGATVRWYYWVVPVGAAGNGVLSSSLGVTVPAS